MTAASMSPLDRARRPNSPGSSRLFDYKPFLVFICLLPALGLLLVFLTYPLGLGIWLAFTDTTIGRDGECVGLENFEYLFEDPMFWSAVFYSVFYTAVATVGKFGARASGWRCCSTTTCRSRAFCAPSSCCRGSCRPCCRRSRSGGSTIRSSRSSPTSRSTCSAFATTISTSSASAWPARWSLIAANIWRGIPFVAISLLAGLQTISPSLYEAALLDGATAWQRFRFITFPMLLPILAIVMTFSIIFTFTDFQLVYAITRGGPVNSTHLMATLAFQRGIPGGKLGEGAAIAVAMIPFLVFATLFSYFALARRKWQQGEAND